MACNRLTGRVGIIVMFLAAGSVVGADVAPVEPTVALPVVPVQAYTRGEDSVETSPALPVELVDQDTSSPPCTGSATSVPALVSVETFMSPRFVVRVIDQATLDEMVSICRGQSPQLIVVGKVVTGNGGYNHDDGFVWSWHLAEDNISLVEAAIEICDERATAIENQLESWVNHVYCPWSTRIVAIHADNTVAGDIDTDGGVDLADFAWLSRCVTGPGGSCLDAGTQCCAPDVDGDADIDLADFAPVQAGFPPAPLPPSNCCETGHGPGCDDPEIEACVCAQAPHCCTTDWDELCLFFREAFDCGECPTGEVR